MIQIMPKINLLNFKNEFKDEINRITYRGYSKEPPVVVTGAYYSALNAGEIKPLPVGELSNLACPTRMDIYMGRIKKKDGKTTWGRVTGQIIDKCIHDFTKQYQNEKDSKLKVFDHLIKKSSDYLDSFVEVNKRQIGKLNKLKSTPEEDENRLIKTLDYTLRYELSMLFLQNSLTNGKANNMSINCELEIIPNCMTTGISKATPDFFIPELSIIGDIKSGVEFKRYYPLTAAGYALAYENAHNTNVDLGLIYFFPTRQRDFSLAHLHIFVIDDILRAAFFQARDKSFEIMKDKNNYPPFPENDTGCSFCKYEDDCKLLRLRLR
ncbi:MAG: CRISPR-associated protein Cas4 [Planctomycetota bacterium]